MKQLRRCGMEQWNWGSKVRRRKFVMWKRFSSMKKMIMP
ncbi:hypothetical protein A2U01_0074453, partial [Trifolium medium]|nr:hypothetical protein [Trifolium medium]